MTPRPPLETTKVLDLSRMFPGAFCSMLLADLGAEVVKVEAPGFGDGLRGMAAPGMFNATHTALNRGKQSLALDLRSPGAPEVLRRLVRWADVVIESHRPGQLDQMGIGYEALRVENPALVWCSITGFGSSGPNAQAPGHDLTFLGSSGLLANLAEGAPTPPDVTVSIPLAASLAVSGILAALLDAARTGEGRSVDVNMVDSAMLPLAEEIARVRNAPGPGWGLIAARNVYECADGRWVTVAATEPKSWSILCEALDAPDLADHRLGVDEEAARDRLAELFATKPAAEWVAHPGLAGGVGPVNETADLLTDPQVTERGSLVALEGSDVEVLANPVRFDGADGRGASAAVIPPPDLGADTDAALAAAGFAPEEITALRADGVVA